VAGLKDSSGDPTRLLEELAAFTKPIYVGSAALLAYAGMLGGAGAILAAANLEPELCADAFAGKVRAQRDLLAAHKLTSLGGIPALKAELARRHGTSAAYR
jgi:dihydrodipicolinate synthase/N-acetylneuraminate lyase